MKVVCFDLDDTLNKEIDYIKSAFQEIAEYAAAPALANYEYFVKRYPGCNDFIYVGDNPDKDFIAPKTLGWETICLKDDGSNIHKQDFSAVGNDAMPISPSLYNSVGTTGMRYKNINLMSRTQKRRGQVDCLG